MYTMLYVYFVCTIAKLQCNTRPPMLCVLMNDCGLSTASQYIKNKLQFALSTELRFNGYLVESNSM